MALHTTFSFSPALLTSTRLPAFHLPKNVPQPTTKLHKSVSIRCLSSDVITIEDPLTTRRSANYPSSAWDYDHLLQSLAANDSEDKYRRQVEGLKEEVRESLMNGEMKPLAKLELVDAVQRLGLKYHFEMEIKNALHILHSNASSDGNDELYSVALRYRLFRQHGYDVSKDVFERFKDETGKFKASLCKDAKGLLSMYEASFFGLEGEDIIDEAKAFSTGHLKDLKGTLCGSLARKVEHALDMPVHWRLTRMEARWFIDTYEQEQHLNPTLLRLAKLEFNMVQAIHQKEVSKLARWWMDLGLNKMAFARDRLVEHYYWCCGMAFEPQFGLFREMGTKIICLITTIDDVYDVYGSLEELELFTDFVDRWDVNGIDKLPDPIRTIFLAMYNTGNEIGYTIIREKGFNIIPYLSKTWANLCKAYLVEAKWYHKGYKPTLEKYLDNAVVSIAAPLMLFSSYFLTADKITVEALDYINKLPSLMRCSSLVLRLTNDLGTSSDELARGDNLKSIQCYMNETGVSDNVARDHINDLVHEAWKVMNKEMLGNYPFQDTFIHANPNLARAAQFFYHYGDGHGVPGNETKGRLFPLLLEPVPVNQKD
ncbi:(R)-limonene synthase, putative [Ricinus communis]|uniref:(R)-limonene synthase, putative n=1 Tax=Ricinus communis TaxID=3988 RepID=B9RPM0_RICCO|nr:(R)-limonene synthase, putative [Ricinus communis]|eukprot:XP_002515689.1 monoterpene synthase [Ricinus communis]